MSKLSILDSKETRSTPYAVSYSHDGRYLAYGEGSYYGDGNILIIDDQGRDIARLFEEGEKKETDQDNYTVSGICFDTSTNYIAASLWAPNHSYCPAKLFQLKEDRLVEIDEFREDFANSNDHGLEYRGYATGVCLIEDKIIVRRSCCPEHTLRYYPIPKIIETKNLNYHLTSQRLGVLANAVVTGCHRPRVLTQQVFGKPVKIVTFGDGRESISSNLLYKRLDTEDDFQIFGMPHVVSAICANKDGSELVTGGADGSIAFWKYDNPLNLSLIDDNILQMEKLVPSCKDDKCQRQASSTYNGNSIVAISYTAKEHSVITVEASGHLRIWHQEELVSSFHMDSGSPRAIAAHPLKSIVSIAMKGPKEDSGPGGKLETIDLESILNG